MDNKLMAILAALLLSAAAHEMEWPVLQDSEGMVDRNDVETAETKPYGFCVKYES